MVFPSPAAEVRSKWQLASADGLCPLLTLPNGMKPQIDSLVADVSNDKRRQ